MSDATDVVFMFLFLTGAVIAGIYGYESAFWGCLILSNLHRLAIKL